MNGNQGVDPSFYDPGVASTFNLRPEDEAKLDKEDAERSAYLDRFKHPHCKCRCGCTSKLGDQAIERGIIKPDGNCVFCTKRHRDCRNPECRRFVWQSNKTGVCQWCARAGFKLPPVQAVPAESQSAAVQEGFTMPEETTPKPRFCIQCNKTKLRKNSTGPVCSYCLDDGHGANRAPRAKKPKLTLDGSANFTPIADAASLPDPLTLPLGYLIRCVRRAKELIANAKELESELSP